MENNFGALINAEPWQNSLACFCCPWVQFNLPCGVSHIAMEECFDEWVPLCLLSCSHSHTGYMLFHWLTVCGCNVPRNVASYPETQGRRRLTASKLHIHIEFIKSTTQMLYFWWIEIEFYHYKKTPLGTCLLWLKLKCITF